MARRIGAFLPAQAHSDRALLSFRMDKNTLPAVTNDPTKTLAQLLPNGATYQNGVRPGARKFEQFKEVLTLRGVPALCSQDGKGREAIAYVKLFDPCGAWICYITEWDGQDEIYGLVTLFEDELGYNSLAGLATERGARGIGLEIDMSFRPMTLREALSKRP